MSLLTRRARHTVEVQLQTYVASDRGVDELTHVGAPIPVRCAVQDVRDWSSEEEIEANGLQLLSMRRIFSRRWPGDVHSLVYFRGDVFETIGTPQHRDMSRRTEHWTITLRWVQFDTRAVGTLRDMLTAP